MDADTVIRRVGDTEREDGTDRDHEQTDGESHAAYIPIEHENLARFGVIPRESTHGLKKPTLRENEVL